VYAYGIEGRIAPACGGCCAVNAIPTFFEFFCAGFKGPATFADLVDLI